MSKEVLPGSSRNAHAGLRACRDYCLVEIANIANKNGAVVHELFSAYGQNAAIRAGWKCYRPLITPEDVAYREDHKTNVSMEMYPEVSDGFVYSVDSVYYGDVLYDMLQKYGQFYATVHYANYTNFRVALYNGEAVYEERQGWGTKFVAQGGSEYKHPTLYLRPEDRTLVYGAIPNGPKRTTGACQPYMVSKVVTFKTSAYTGYGLLKFMKVELSPN